MVGEKFTFSYYNHISRRLENREVKKIGCIWRRVGYLSLSYELESILCNKQTFYIHSLDLASFCHVSSLAGAPLFLFLVPTLICP